MGGERTDDSILSVAAGDVQPPRKWGRWLAEGLACVRRVQKMPQVTAFEEQDFCVHILRYAPRQVDGGRVTHRVEDANGVEQRWREHDSAVISPASVRGRRKGQSGGIVVITRNRASSRGREWLSWSLEYPKVVMGQLVVKQQTPVYCVSSGGSLETACTHSDLPLYP